MSIWELALSRISHDWGYWGVLVLVVVVLLVGCRLVGRYTWGAFLLGGLLCAGAIGFCVVSHHGYLCRFPSYLAWLPGTLGMVGVAGLSWSVLPKMDRLPVRKSEPRYFSEADYDEL